MTSIDRGALFFILIYLIEGLSSLPPPLRDAAKDRGDKEDMHFWRKAGQEELAAKLKEIKYDRKVKNVIIFVGDGMGINTITPARIYKGQKQGKSGEESSLSWESFPYTGLSKTYNTDFQVPDSAGTATAIFSGVKTRMGMLGLDNSVSYNVCDSTAIEKAKLSNIFWEAIQSGRETGVVTTTRITHATPGATYAHTPNRDWESDIDIPENFRDSGCDDIAKQLVYSFPAKKMNVLFGGGREKFTKVENGGDRKDEDLVSSWLAMKKNHSHAYLSSKVDLDNWNNKLTEYVLGLFSIDNIPYELSRDPSTTPSLEDMTAAALKRLDGKFRKGQSAGYTLLVEGGRIDHGHHDNFAKKAFEEVLQLEKSVQLAIDTVDLRDTLIIVTADHSHAITMNGYPDRGNDILGYIFSERGKKYRLSPSGEKRPYSTISYANGPGFDYHFKNNEFVDLRTLNVTDNEYRFPSMWSGPDHSETHGGEDVPIYAIGPQSHLFSGVHEESYIAHVVNYGTCRSEHDAEFCSSGSNLLRESSSFIFVISLFSVILWGFS